MHAHMYATCMKWGGSTEYGVYSLSEGAMVCVVPRLSMSQLLEFLYVKATILKAAKFSILKSPGFSGH